MSLCLFPGGPWWDSCSHCKSRSTEQNASFCLSTFKRNNILMIHAIGVILLKWTMIYIFHVKTGFLRGWLIVLVWNNSSGNLFQNWLIHTLHGLSLGFFFLSLVLSDNMCAWSIKIKLSLSLPSQIQFVFTKTLYGEQVSVCVCVYIIMCIHKCFLCVYIYIYRGEKRTGSIANQSLFLIKG